MLLFSHLQPLHMIARAAAADAACSSPYINIPTKSNLVSALCLLTLSSAWLVTLDTSSSSVARTFFLVDSSIPRIIGALGLLPICSLYLILIPHFFEASYSLGKLSRRYFHAMDNYLCVENLDFGVRNATFHGNIDLVRFLTPNGQISQRNLVSCLNIAAGRGHSDLMRYLLQLGRITDTIAGELLYISTYGGSIECMNILLAADYQIPQRYLEDAIVLAAEQGFVGILTNLLQHLPELRPAIFHRATERSSSQLIQDILQPYSARAQLEIASMTEDPNHFFVDLQEVKRHPKIYIDRIASRGWPNQIRLRGSLEFLTVDLGGLTKEFLSTLIQAIATHQLLPMNSSQLPYLPSAFTKRQQEETTLHLHQLGLIYQTIYHRNQHRTDKLLTGVFFHPQFFTLMAIACHASLDRMEKLNQIARLLQEIMPPSCHMPLAIIQLPPTDPVYCQLIADYQETIGCITPQEARAAAIEEVDQYRLAAEAFYSGLSAPVQERIVEARAQDDFVGLLAEMQGHAITPQALASSLVLVEDHDGLQTALDWLQAKILVSNATWCEKFVHTVTGSKSLFNTVIRIRESRHSGIEIHTCFNLIELPFGMDFSPAGRVLFEEIIDAVIVNPNYNTR